VADSIVQTGLAFLACHTSTDSIRADLCQGDAPEDILVRDTLISGMTVFFIRVYLCLFVVQKAL
jgi:hypothetical protein